MKKNILFFFTFLISSIILSAQENTGINNSSAKAKEENTNNKKSEQVFHFGLKASPAITWLKPNSKFLSYNSTRFNIDGGLIMDFNFTDNYAFSTGFEIVSTGGKLNYPVTAGDSVFYKPENDSLWFYLIDRTYRLRYVNIPLTLKLKTNQIGAMVYYGQFGFDFGLRWRAMADDNGTQKKISTFNDDIDIQKEINFLRLSLNVGLGIEYNLAGSTSMMIGVNYNNGFTNVFRKESKYLQNRNGKIKQDAFANYLALSIGVLF